MLQIVGRSLGNFVSLLTAGSSALSLSLSSKSRDPHPLRSLAPWRYCSWFPARIQGNCHPDGRRTCGRPSLAFARKIAISISLSISIRGIWGMRKHLRRYCCCLRCDLRVSRTGHRHPSIGDVAGSTTQPVSEGDIRPGCVWMRPPRLPLVLLSWWLRYLTGRRLPISEQGETDIAVADKCRHRYSKKTAGRYVAIVKCPRNSSDRVYSAFRAQLNRPIPANPGVVIHRTEDLTSRQN